MTLERFVEFLQDEAGETVRSAGWYREDEFEIVYLRDDIDPDVARSVAENLHQEVTWDWQPPPGEARRYFGPRMASVEIYRRSVVLRLPADEESGVVVTFDLDVARNLHEFIADCQDVLGYEG